MILLEAQWTSFNVTIAQNNIISIKNHEFMSLVKCSVKSDAK